jgi:hypothetical protein
MMDRLDRVLNLLERYDNLLVAALSVDHNGTFGWTLLASLRQEKELLTKELIEHGCRRKY